MTPTIYSFHRAQDNAFLAKAHPDELQTVAATVARSIGGNGNPRVAYVHNGLGVVAAGRCQHGAWTDLARHAYADRDQPAREARVAVGLPTFERKGKPVWPTAGKRINPHERTKK